MIIMPPLEKYFAVSKIYLFSSLKLLKQESKDVG
jgi:hypothetical protein